MLQEEIEGKDVPRFAGYISALVLLNLVEVLEQIHLLGAVEATTVEHLVSKVENGANANHGVAVFIPGGVRYSKLNFVGMRMR